MPEFSARSEERLRSCDPLLQALFHTVVVGQDCTILEGHRGRDRQNRLVAEGQSKTNWPHSKHNDYPSRAVDVAPYPIDWADSGSAEQRQKALARFYFFAGYVRAVADELGIGVRWGGDWDGDGMFDDQAFDDLVHFELIAP